MTNERSRAATRAFGLGLAVIFAAVGALFVFWPAGVLGFFNAISRRLGMREGPVERSFFGVLAGAYMFVVTLLAWFMYKRPGEKVYPWLLAQAKIASSILSFLMFVLHAPWLIYLANGIVDGLIGFAVLLLFFRVRP
jgi:hypothetical protein